MVNPEKLFHVMMMNLAAFMTKWDMFPPEFQNSVLPRRIWWVDWPGLIHTANGKKNQWVTHHYRCVTKRKYYTDTSNDSTDKSDKNGQRFEKSFDDTKDSSL